MQPWNLGLNDPQSLGLAADSRLSKLNYTNDHIWELFLSHGDPTALTLQTTFGLRARNMRIFPQFTKNHITLSDPKQFDKPPVIQKFFPNYIKLKFSPYKDVEIEMDYWIPDCQSIAGRVHILNTGPIERRFDFELLSLLNPTGDGAHGMLPKQIEAVNVLCGQTGDLSPVTFITGGAKGIGSPYPCLSHNLKLPPGASRKFTWAQVSLNSVTDSFKHARQIATRKWASEIAKIELINSDQIEISSGNPDWDAVFAFGQKVAKSLLYDGNQHLKETSFVNSRQPDQGYSILGDGSDNNHLWNGQSALDAWYLSQYLLPGSPDILEGILLNFFNTQNKDGLIDWKPGLAGQRSQIQAFPILSTLTWQLYQYQNNTDFLKLSYPHLIKFILAWFNKNHDRNGDGIPEWDNLLQTGFDDNPLFSQYYSWTQGTEISLTGSPDLCSYLYKECKSLIQIAKEIEVNEHLEILEDFQERLKIAVENSWDVRAGSYRYWDRDNNKSTVGKRLGQRKGSGEIHFGLTFKEATRLQIKFQIGSEVALNTEIHVHGTLENGQHRVEKFNQKNIRWMPGLGSITLETLYSELDFIQVKDFPINGKVSVISVDLKKQDHSLLTPIWAGIPKPERLQKIITKKLSGDKAFHHEFGIPACLTKLKNNDSAILKNVWFPWNMFIAKGLIDYQAKPEAVDIFQRLMKGIVKTCKKEHAFKKHHHAETGVGYGDRNSLAGLPPLGIFLDLIGIQIHSPNKVTFNGFNPFPLPVKLYYQGLAIECNSNNTRLTFPNNQTVLIEDPTPCIVEMTK